MFKFIYYEFKLSIVPTVTSTISRLIFCRYKAFVEVSQLLGIIQGRFFNLSIKGLYK